jgi:leucine dehydrogenase
VDPDAAAGTKCDVFAPCALGGTIDSDSIDRLRCEIVCGSANNLLADDAYAAELTKRGILYAPDFIANAGGLINVYGELRGLGRKRLDELVDGIGTALGRVFEVASARSVAPLDAAKAVAEEALDAASGGRFGADLDGLAVGRVQAPEDDRQSEHRDGGDERQRGAVAVDDLAR